MIATLPAVLCGGTSSRGSIGAAIGTTITWLVDASVVCVANVLLPLDNLATCTSSGGPIATVLTFVETPVRMPCLPKLETVEGATISLPQTMSAVRSITGRAGLVECRGNTSLFLATGCASPRYAYRHPCLLFGCNGQCTNRMLAFYLYWHTPSYQPDRTHAVLRKDFSARRPLFPYPFLALICL